MLRAALLVWHLLGRWEPKLNPWNASYDTLAIDIETGSEAGLGFKMPHLATGFGLNNQLENILSCKGAYPTRQTRNTSPMTAARLNDGAGLLLDKSELRTDGELRHSNLWTSHLLRVRGAVGGMPFENLDLVIREGYI